MVSDFGPVDRLIYRNEKELRIFTTTNLKTVEDRMLVSNIFLNRH
jgi:hypothetical protein